MWGGGLGGEALGWWELLFLSTSLSFSRQCPSPGLALQAILPGNPLFSRGRSLFPFSPSLRPADAEPFLLQ